MSPLLLIIIFALLALVLFAIEAFIVPGFGITGIAATVCVVIADSLVYYYYGTFWATLALFGSIVVVLFFFRWLAKSRTIERLSLHANIDGTNATPAQLSVKPGDEGKALTRLALIGNACINGADVEVKSASGFIEEGTLIKVTAVKDALILVEKRTDGDNNNIKGN